uniref:Uncharacterized protein n=2 Tax=Phaeomonas parva TaxID=124430 RepID=A0A7S1XQ14_9STRA|mmetsp:Transcript_22996/g.71520  ORF Transcript_22996/g.71520 Transcript_22996/m.71520 type:complete len:124 (+) Transcript_22996:701-1072(+)
MGVSMAMGRDETLMEFLFRVLSRVVMNITFGLLFALINFMFAIGAFLWSNAPDPVSGLIFFGLAMLAGFSIVATYLMVIYVAAAGTVVAGATIAMQNARALPASQRGAYIHGGRLHRDRPHYD